MGNNSSQEELEFVGYRVLGVQPHSPASDCGLVSFFDFIIAANGVPLRTLDTTFIDLIKASEDLILPLTVYNWKSNTTREVSLIPSRNWPGEGMLGITIRFDTYSNAEDYICHITDVEPNSPADLAGLMVDSDYILGTSEKVFKDVDALFEELQENIHKPIEFYVYNSLSDEVRTVVIMPSNEWGGEGILGAGVASGYLHRFPRECRETIGRASDGYFKSSVSSPFGSNIPPLQTIPQTITFTNPENNLLQSNKLNQLNQLNHDNNNNNNHNNLINSSNKLEQSIPQLPNSNLNSIPNQLQNQLQNKSVMSIEECQKLAMEMKTTSINLENNGV